MSKYVSLLSYKKQSKLKWNEREVHPRTGHEDPGGKYRYICTLSLTSALYGASRKRHAPTALPPGNRHGTHFTRGCVGPRAGQDGCGKPYP
jgi:hypothetical protein